ncbi:MAG: V-type ATPase 116kDa subunit family protein [Patescibacteria group bacterium]|nr:V-type ATPase 116kDa subunit family protein [Patescibacteria group bacterium]
MALASIHKISLLGLRSQKKEVTKVLQDFGSLQVVPSKQKQKNTSFEETKKDIDYELARLDFLISFLSSSDQDYRADYPYVDGKYLLTEDQKQICAAQYDATTVDICRNIETQVVEYDNEIKKLKSEHSLLSAFPTLGVELHDLEDTATLTQKTGSISVQDIDEFRSAISSVSQYTSVSEMPQKGMKQCLHIAYLKEDDVKMQEVFSEFSFQDMVLPRRRGTVSEELERITRRIIKVESLLAEEKAKVSGLMTQLLPAMVRYDMYYKQAQRIHTKSDYHLYDYTFSVDAFIETKKQDQLLQIFKDNSLTVVVENIALEEGENPPVKMENNALWKPLEGVTKLYGIPGHNDMDPTPLMGIFFLTFFGLCLTDTAYGLFIMLITGSILLFKKHIGSVLK